MGEVSVNYDGTEVYGLNFWGEGVYLQGGFEADFTTIPSFDGMSRPGHLAVSGDGMHVWGISSDGSIWYRPKGETEFERKNRS